MDPIGSPAVMTANIPREGKSAANGQTRVAAGVTARLKSVVYPNVSINVISRAINEFSNIYLTRGNHILSWYFSRQGKFGAMVFTAVPITCPRLAHKREWLLKQDTATF